MCTEAERGHTKDEPAVESRGRQKNTSILVYRIDKRLVECIGIAAAWYPAIGHDREFRGGADFKSEFLYLLVEVLSEQQLFFEAGPEWSQSMYLEWQPAA